MRCRWIINIDCCPAGNSVPEKRDFGFQVMLNGFVKIEVISGKIGEHGEVKLNSIHPVKGQGMRGNFHSYVIDASISHLPQHPMKILGFRGSNPGRNRSTTQVIIDGGNPTYPIPCFFQYGLDEIGGGGFSVRSGDAN